MHDWRYWLGLSLALAGVFSGAVSFVTIAECWDTGTSVLCVYVSVCGLGVSAAASAIDPNSMMFSSRYVAAHWRILSTNQIAGSCVCRISQMTWRIWLVLFLLALAGGFAYVTITKALQVWSQCGDYRTILELSYN